MSDRELVALMSAILTAGLLANGDHADSKLSVEYAMQLLKVVEQGPKYVNA